MTQLNRSNAAELVSLADEDRVLDVVASSVFNLWEAVNTGGIGTVLETMMVWQLHQVHKLRDTPLILVGEMYVELVEWCTRHMIRSDSPLANAEDMNIPICVADGQSVLQIVRDHHDTWTQAQRRVSLER